MNKKRITQASAFILGVGVMVYLGYSTVNQKSKTYSITKSSTQAVIVAKTEPHALEAPSPGIPYRKRVHKSARVVPVEPVEKEVRELEPDPVVLAAPPVMAAPPPTPLSTTALGGLTSTLYGLSSGKGKVMPYREVITAKNVPMDKGTISFVLFNHRPVTEATGAKYLEVCKYWEAALSTLTTEAKASLAENEVSTTPLYWLTRNYAPMLSCGNLYDYDYDAAAELSAVLSTDDVMASEGPFIVLFRSRTQHLVLDVSKFSPPDTQRAFDTWRTQVCKQDPMSGASLIKFREYFRALVQDYGESILKVVEK